MSDRYRADLVIWSVRMALRNRPHPYGRPREIKRELDDRFSYTEIVLAMKLSVAWGEAGVRKDGRYYWKAA